MAGLLGDSWDDPRSAMNMAAAAGLLRGDFGGALLGASNAYSQSQDAAMKKRYMDMQMQNYASEIEARKMKAEQQKRLMEMAQRLTAARGQPTYQQGQMGSGTMGVLPTAPGVDPMQPGARGPSGIGAADLNDLAAFRMLGGEDMLPYYKAANEGFERKPGTFYDIPGRGREFIPDVKSGMNYQGGRITGIPGYTDFLTQQTFAQEGPKALLNSAGRVNLRPNADGTQSPISELAENPTLQNVLSNVFGGRGPVVPPAAPVGMVPRSAPAMPQGSPGRPVVSPDAQRGADAESIRMIQAELQNPNLSPQDRAAMTREVQRLQAAQSMPGFPTPTLVRPGQGYGKTTAQQSQEAAEAAGQKAAAEAKAKAEAERTAGQTKKADSARDMLGNIWRARVLLESGATGSLFGAATDATLGAFGMSTAGGQNADKLETISGWLMANVPRMEGPQSNYDVQNYKIMAGRVGDRSYPVEGRLAALQELESIQQKYAHLNGGTTSQAGGQQPAAGKRFEAMPPAQAYKGKFMTDETTGERYQSNGMAWVKVK